MRPAMILLPIFLLAAPAFAQDAAKGEADFRKCRACHSITAPDGTQIVKGGKTGPNLYGVVGRKAGSVPKYTYSAANKAFGQVWTEALLDKYLTNPQAVVKGTKMAYPGQKDPAKRAKIIAYLKTLK